LTLFGAASHAACLASILDALWRAVPAVLPFNNPFLQNIFPAVLTGRMRSLPVWYAKMRVGYPTLEKVFIDLSAFAVSH
jgi:hypothetical protein